MHTDIGCAEEEHEICRRPTDRKEVISRITRMQDINIVICGRLLLKQHMNVLPQIARINTDFFFWITDFAEFTDFRVYNGVASDK